MPNFSFSESEILSAKPVESGWYDLEVSAVQDSVGKSDPNFTTTTVTLTMENNGTKVPIPYYLSSNPKSVKNVIHFFSCFIKGGKIPAGQVLDAEELIGSKVQGYLVWDPKFKSVKVEDLRPAAK